MKYPYQDPTLSVEARTEDLLSRMTLEEKFAQLRLLFPSMQQAQQTPFDCSVLEENRNRAGAIYNPYSMSPESINIIQDWYRNNTRLGIPVAIHSESLHGGSNAFDTTFPQAIGLAATFHKELMRQIAGQIGKEVRASGNTLVYSPNLDLSRDPRWGRTEENYGEDPYLTGEMGVAYIQAVQQQGVGCCPKHYTAHGAPEGGLNLAPVHAGEREVREVMLPPFEKAVKEGHAMGIMPAYSELDGVPMHASRYYLTNILREELGFEGQVISDYSAVSMLYSLHHVAQTAGEAGKLALYAGVDMEAPHCFGFGKELEEAVRTGEVPEAWVDTAVRRILRHKFAMGLFENPYADPDAQKKSRTADALWLTRQAAAESVVLLKNENDLLPLSERIGKIAVIGPNADYPQLGDYTSMGALERTVTLRRGLEERLGSDRVLYAQGCTTAGGTQEQWQQALVTAKQADAVILALGDNSNFFGGIGWGHAEPDGSVAVTSGEGFDMCSLELPGRQQQLMEAVCAVGKPVILILQSGRPYAIRWAKEKVPAILQAWYPGEQGGHALADILFGDVNPSGRLPISFPKSVGHLPVYYNHKVSARGYYKKSGTPTSPGRDYVFDSPDALFPFGYGLSYTTFAYSDMTVSPENGKCGEEVKVSIAVKNTGKRAGFEVVQLYVTDKACRITPFVKQLRGFEKIWLEPGEQKTVEFKLGFEDFAFINEQMRREVEPGEFLLQVADLKRSVYLA